MFAAYFLNATATWWRQNEMAGVAGVFSSTGIRQRGLIVKSVGLDAVCVRLLLFITRRCFDTLSGCKVL